MTSKALSKDTSLALKGIAIILMLVHHLFSCNQELMVEYGVTTFFASESTLIAFSEAAKVCVAIFVFLSGYGIAVSLEKWKGTISSYTKRRYLKLEKGVLVVYIVSILTCFLRSDGISCYFIGGKVQGVLFMVFDALGLSSFLETPMYNETWWYLSIALLIIFITPLLVRAYEKFGICLVGIAALFPLLGLGYTNFTNYLFPLVLGIFTAKSSLLTKVYNLCTGGRRLLFILINILAVIILTYIRIHYGYICWVDGFSALSLALIFFALLDVKDKKLFVLPFLGKYSMNMFLIHTLIFEYYFTDFIYMGKNWLLVSLLLIVTSLIGSVAIEAIRSGLSKAAGKLFPGSAS